MRKALATREDERATFQGTFERLGTKRGWQGRQETTVLLRAICDERGQPICDHLWCNLTKQFASLNLQPGDTVIFEARVKAYVKGYLGLREDVYKPLERDFKLSHPTRVRKVEPVSTEPVLPGMASVLGATPDQHRHAVDTEGICL